MDEHAGVDMHAHMPEAPDWLMAEGCILRFFKGDQIFHRQERLRHVYIVRSGTVIIFSMGENGQENKVVMVPEGGIVGEMEAIVGAERIVYSARAFVNCELLRLPVEPFMRWVCADARACWALTRVLAEKLYAASVQSSQYTSSNAMQRLVPLLIQFGAVRVTYTRQELAEACSVSLRTVNRCVKTLQEMDLIGLSRGKIVLSPDQLTRLGDYMHDNT